MSKEAKARIKINRLLDEAGWRFFDNGAGRANIILENNTKIAMTNKNENGYMQVLNPGKYELLKQIRRTVDSADSLFRTQKRYFFVDEVNYFLRSGERVEKIKRLNKDNIITLLPSASNYAGWIDEKKIDLKKEEDVIHFLTHYNATHTTKEN